MRSQPRAWKGSVYREFTVCWRAKLPESRFRGPVVPVGGGERSGMLGSIGRPGLQQAGACIDAPGVDGLGGVQGRRHCISFRAGAAEKGNSGNIS